MLSRDNYLKKQFPIAQDLIVDFVNAVERKKKFKPDYNLIFRHMVSELGELDSAIYHFEKYRDGDATRITRELLDIIFLTCYMASVFGIRLNEFLPKRISEIKQKYNVNWRKHALLGGHRRKSHKKRRRREGGIA